MLSKHQTRVRVQDHPDLAQLCLDYAQELRSEGVERALAWPYDYATTANGLELNPDIRRAYRELLVEDGFDASIFTPDGEAELLEALNAPAGSRSGGKFGVTRFLASLHAHHAHISRAFPDLADVDGPRLVEWAHKHSRGEVPEALLPPTLPAEAASAPPAPTRRDSTVRSQRGGLSQRRARGRRDRAAGDHGSRHRRRPGAAGGAGGRGAATTTPSPIPACGRAVTRSIWCA